MLWERRNTSRIAAPWSLGNKEIARWTSALSNRFASASEPAASGDFIGFPGHLTVEDSNLSVAAATTVT
jgi:hypothetical protein